MEERLARFKGKVNEVSKGLVDLFSQRGITLIEIIISGAILAIVVIAFALMFSWGRGSIDWEGERRVALTLAQEMTERIKSSNFDGVSVFHGLNENPPRDINGNPMNGTGGTPDYSNFRRQVAVEYVDDDNYDQVVVAPGTSNSKRITVRVSSATNPPHFYEVALQTVVTKH